MQEITKKIKDEALARFAPMVEELAVAGLPVERIVSVYDTIVKNKLRQFYRKKDFTTIGDILKAKLLHPDSKAEMIFYDMLIGAGIKFVFQRSIGPYVVDYLIHDTLVIELDGPQHTEAHDIPRDAYLRRMGYKIIRVPIWVLAIDSEAVLEEIKTAMEECLPKKKNPPSPSRRRRKRKVS